MKTLTGIVARVLFALPLAVFGLNHFIYGKMMTGMVPGFLPGKLFWVYASGLGLILAAVSIIINKLTKTASLLLALLLLSTALFVHLPGVFNPETMMSSLPQFLKDTIIVGGALILAGISKDK